MKNIHLSSEKQGIIAFCIIQTLCIFVAAYCALNDTSVKTSAALTIMFLVCAALCEIAKYKIGYTRKYNGTTNRTHSKKPNKNG